MGTLATPATRYLRERVGRAEITRKSAHKIACTLQSLDESYGDRPLNMFGERAVERWLEAHPEWKASTRSTYMSAVRMFARWMVRRKIIRRDPFTEIALPKRPRPAPKPLTRDEIQSLLRVAPDARARLIIWLMFGLGLRCIGVASMRIEDIDHVGRTLHVREKGGHARRLPLTNEVVVELDRYMFFFPATSGPLIRSYTRPWEGMTAQHIGNLVGVWLKEAGVKRNPFDGMSAHALRRTALTEVAEATGDAFVVAEMAGWASISTAAHYVRRASVERVRTALEARDAL